MPNITITFDNDLNVSLQVGDVAYFVPTASNSSFSVNSSAVVEIGKVISISGGEITINGTGTAPSPGDFILFSKDNKVNMTSLLGYYAEATIRNNSRSRAELFQVSADYFDSSK